MEFRDKIKRLPQKPGVYLFKDNKGEIIYIGKAIKLKNRVSSYFSGKPSDPKTARLVSKIADFEFIIVDNEVEALVLEANLVREHRPHYNVNLKDDKRFPYIHVTDEAFPRIEVERRKSSNGQYFGPFTDVRAMRSTIALIQRHFRLRCCTHALPEHAPARSCLNFDIGRCDAPCQGKVPREEYLFRVEEVVLFLKGKKKELVQRLVERMNRAAAEHNYEEAAEIRDQIKAIDSIWQTQKIDTDLADRDLHALAIGRRSAVAVAMQVRQGRVISRGEFSLSVSEGTEKPEAMAAYLKQYYADNSNPPKEIIVSELPQDTGEIVRFVSQFRGSKVELIMPSRGQKKELIKLVERNAELLLADMASSRKQSQLPFAILDLEKHLRLAKTPRRIEAIDISHLGGTCAVASLVSFIDGKKYSRGYRRFRIKSAQGGDDYASIAEVVVRRFERLRDEGGLFPDLLLIDGGKGQLGAAHKALESLGMGDSVEIASIAKRLEEVYRPNLENSVMLPKDSSALRLLVKIRDEAHRFAVEYQRKRRSKALQAQELSAMEGIGEVRQKKLLTEFESLEQIASTEPEEISKRAKIPVELARKLVEFLSPYRLTILVAALGLSLLTGCTPSPRYIGGARPQTVAEKPQKKKEEPSPEKQKPQTSQEKPPQVKKSPAETPVQKPKALEKKATEPKKQIARKDEDTILGAVNLYLGTPYKYGGNGPEGIDCSGFAHVVMKSAGQNIPRTSRDQFKKGSPVSKPAFGDLVFFKMRGREVDHVGIFLGGSRFAHASRISGVTIDSLDDEYYKKRYLGARRFE